MRLINPSYQILTQDVSGTPKGIITSPETIQEALILSMYKHIEVCGRTCYKSTDKITEDSAKPFVDRMISSQHYAMLEHGTVYLAIPKTTYAPEAVGPYMNNPYSKVNDCDEFIFTDKYGDKVAAWCVTTNLRVLVENDCLEDLEFVCMPTKYHERRYTVKFICNRQVSHEFVRHRVFSFAQESTRYCNYTKDKFGSELTFIKPCWCDDAEIRNYGAYHVVDRAKTPESAMMAALNKIEEEYFYLINHGWKPQQAATILPNALKTELIVTGFASDWSHFFDLRALGTTGAPHPQAKELAEPLYNEFIKLDYLNTKKQ